MSQRRRSSTQNVKPQTTPAPMVPAGAAPTPGRDWLVAVALPVLIAIVAAAYHPAWYGTPLWDDDAHLTRPELRSVAGLWRIWFELGATQQYYPVVHSTFWIGARLWGDHTVGYHFLNIALHGTSAFLLFVLLRRLRIAGALLAAAIFAVHPLHVESVAWMTELKNTLSGLFFLGAALIYLTFDRTRSTRHYAGALALYGLALFSKTVTAVLPPALLVVFWWQRGRLDWRRDVRPLIPFIVLGVVAGLATAVIERTFIGAEGRDFTLSWIERSLVAGRVLLFYAWKLVWPARLMFMYPHWDVNGNVWWQYLYPAAAVAILVVAWRMRRLSRAPFAALLVFAICLAPALGFVNVYPFRFSYVADHFQYLASMALIVLIASAMTAAIRRRLTGRRAGAAEVVVLLSICGVLAWRTHSEAAQYVDAETLYRSTLARNPACWLAHLNLATIDIGRSDRTAAIAHYEAALRIKPDEPQVHNNLGTTYLELGRYEAAVGEHQAAIGYAPNYAEAYLNLGVDQQHLNRFSEALAAYDRALEIKPRLELAHYNRGIVLLKLGRPDDAENALRKAVELQPDYPDARRALADVSSARAGESASPDALRQLGASVAEAGKFAEALRYFELAVARDPSPAARTELADVLWRVGRIADAETQLEVALAAAPVSAGAYRVQGHLLQSKSEFAAAERAYRRSLSAPGGADSAETHNDLGVVLAIQHRTSDALAEFREAVRLKPDYPQAQANLARALQMTAAP